MDSCSSCSSKAPKGNINKAVELHICMGLNACKGHDRFGTNECAGMGFCATIEHHCHAINNCRGQGGCGLYGSGVEQDNPGENPCAWMGSCASPVENTRLSTAGPNIGKGVWARARERFEERMRREVKREYGPSPFPDGPPRWWLDTINAGGSCS
ncbi:MAG: hypothetical protein AAF570_15520 [Bacteroidota bacterium]